MINTLYIGSYIYDRLNQIVGVKSYPIIAENGAKFPFIVYRRVNLNSNACKDGYYEDNVVVEITVVSDTYAGSVDMASKVRNMLEGHTQRYDDYEIVECNLSYAEEEFNNNAYIQKMQYNLKINN